jgi:hypothetical protein
MTLFVSGWTRTARASATGVRSSPFEWCDPSPEYSVSSPVWPDWLSVSIWLNLFSWKNRGMRREIMDVSGKWYKQQQEVSLTSHDPFRPGGIVHGTRPGVHNMREQEWKQIWCSGRMCDTTDTSGTASHQPWTCYHPTGHDSVMDDLFPVICDEKNSRKTDD